MEKRDFSDYETCRAADHEEIHRLLGLACLTGGLCRRRACRRKAACSGPMLPSRHQQSAVRAQQALGLSGKACATLPSCLADLEDWRLPAIRDGAQTVADGRGDILEAVKGDRRKCSRVTIAALRAAVRRRWHGRKAGKRAPSSP